MVPKFRLKKGARLGPQIPGLHPTGSYPSFVPLAHCQGLDARTLTLSLSDGAFCLRLVRLRGSPNLPRRAELSASTRRLCMASRTNHAHREGETEMKIHNERDRHREREHAKIAVLVKKRFIRNQFAKCVKPGPRQHASKLKRSLTRSPIPTTECSNVDKGRADA